MSLILVTYGDSACDLGAAMAKAGRRCLFHETTGLVRMATICVFAPWRHCVEFPSDFRRMERKVAEKRSRNETGGCCHVSRFNEPAAARRKLCFLPVSRVLQWRSQETVRRSHGANLLGISSLVPRFNLSCHPRLSRFPHFETITKQGTNIVPCWYSIR